MEFITGLYTKTHSEKMKLIETSNVSELSETILFYDSLPKETLHKPLDEKDAKIFQLEKKVSFLMERINGFERKIFELEEMYLDMSIKINKSE